MIEFRNGQAYLDPEDRDELIETYQSYSPSKRKRLAESKRPPDKSGFMECIVWAMCRFDPDPKLATESLAVLLATGELKLQGQRGRPGGKYEPIDLSPVKYKN